MWQRFLAILLIVLGLASVLLGVTWKRIYPAESYWSEAQAEQHLAAFLAAKEAAHDDSRRRNEPDPPELVAARQRWERSEADLAGAQAARDRTPLLLGVAGLLLAGGGCYLLLTIADEQSRAKPSRRRH